MARIAAPLLLSLLFAVGVSPASDVCRAGGGEHDEARQVVERGEALPLAEILNRIGNDLRGEIAGVSFKRKRDRWVYEFKVIGASGRLSEIYVDAASAAILKREER